MRPEPVRQLAYAADLGIDTAGLDGVELGERIERAEAARDADRSERRAERRSECRPDRPRRTAVEARRLAEAAARPSPGRVRNCPACRSLDRGADCHCEVVRLARAGLSTHDAGRDGGARRVGESDMSAIDRSLTACGLAVRRGKRASRAYIPGNWRRPKVAHTDAGRNDSLFRELLRYAGNAAHSDADVARRAEALYQTIDTTHPHAFTAAELAGVVRSVLRYRQIWRDRGWHKPAWIASRAKAGRANRREQQQAKGRTGGIRSGEARREQTTDRDQRIYERIEGDGLSIRQAAAVEGIPRSTVHRVAKRLVEERPATRQQTRTATANRSKSRVSHEATTQGGLVVPAKPAT